MHDFANFSDRLTQALGLQMRPTAITFTAEVPPDVSISDTPAPAGCSFWERGAKRGVSTSAADHRHCAIGVHTHNLAGPATGHGDDLNATLGAMTGLDYVRQAEVEALPVMRQAHAHVVYRPLAECQTAPDVVLLFTHAVQSLVITEAVARVDGHPPVAMGRPACALIPQVINSSRSAISLGCCGARAYLDTLSDDIALWGLRGDVTSEYVDEIETLSKANDVLTQFHANRKLAIEADEEPSVKDTLAAMS